ncbi:triphosphoribosyl-dephospho-CoA synthase, partial [Halorubrum sp. CBA1125]
SARAAALLGGGSSGDGRSSGDTGGESDDVDVDADAVHAVDLADAEPLADAFVAEGINPGTTADITCAALYVALRRGAEVTP